MWLLIVEMIVGGPDPLSVFVLVVDELKKKIPRFIKV